MNDYFNPQRSDEKDCKTYRALTAQLGLLGLNTTIPEGVRALAEKTLGQTREVYDRSIDDFEASVAPFEQSFYVAGQVAIAFNRRIINMAQSNVESSFDLAANLAHAKDIAEMVKLQRDYWQSSSAHSQPRRKKSACFRRI